jgi:hypothetical protein
MVKTAVALPAVTPTESRTAAALTRLRPPRDSNLVPVVPEEELMSRSFLSLALAATLVAGASTASAKEYEFAFSGDAGGYAGGYCPDGSCGHGKYHYDLARGLPFGAYYPNGRDNYGLPPAYCAYSPVGGHCRACSAGNCQYRFYGQPDLFYNYYAWPSCSGIGAELYISPRPVPPHVGHTFITYQPLMPHEFLYEHHRTYHRYYNGGQGLNRTCVHWYSVPWK